MQENKLFGHKLAPYPTTFRSGTMQGRSALHIDIPKGQRGLEDANYMLPPCWWSLSQRRCKPRTGCQNMFACKAIIWISKLNFGSLRNRRHMQKMAANPNLHLLGSGSARTHPSVRFVFQSKCLRFSKRIWHFAFATLFRRTIFRNPWLSLLLFFGIAFLGSEKYTQTRRGDKLSKRDRWIGSCREDSGIDQRLSRFCFYIRQPADHCHMLCMINIMCCIVLGLLETRHPFL